jgi:hypothetical protein
MRRPSSVDRLTGGEPDPLSEALCAEDLAERARRACDARQIEDLARDDIAP